MLSIQSIFSCLKSDYGIDAATITPLSLGADQNAQVYKVQASDHASYFVKLKRGNHHDINLVIAKLLYEAGIKQIILPNKTISGHLNLHIDDFTLIVYPFIEGQDGFSRNLNDEQWFILGKTLKQIHEIEVPISIQNQMRRESYSTKWRDIVRSFFTLTEAELAGHEIAQRLFRIIQEKKEIIRRLVDIAEKLSQKLKQQPAQFVLCHSDIHGGNVLMDGNHFIYIVDWDEPMMAPKERDLMFIGGGVGNVWNKPHEEEFFYKGYGATKINMPQLAYYRHERIVEDIAVYGQDLLFGATGHDDMEKMYDQFMAMFEPSGVVDIAFKTRFTSCATLFPFESGPEPSPRASIG